MASAAMINMMIAVGDGAEDFGAMVIVAIFPATSYARNESILSLD